MNPLESVRRIFRKPSVEYFGIDGERLRDEQIADLMRLDQNASASTETLEFAEKVQRILDAENAQRASASQEIDLITPNRE